MSVTVTIYLARKTERQKDMWCQSIVPGIEADKQRNITLDKDRSLTPEIIDTAI